MLAATGHRPAFAGAARVVEAEYEWPFQPHANIGPASAVVDARADGATLWTGSQKPHFAFDGVARILGLPQDKVHGIWVPGPGSYGRNDAGDAGIDAALLSKAVGQPVRVQGDALRGPRLGPEVTGFDPPRSRRPRPGRRGDRLCVREQGLLAHRHRHQRERPRLQPRRPADGAPVEVVAGFWCASESYGFANKRLAWETVYSSGGHCQLSRPWALST
jgi:hypothetical protein